MYVYLILVLFILDASLIKCQDYEDERQAVRDANEQLRNVKVFVDVHKHPKTGFSCEGKKAGEYYADPETLCAVYYICLANQYGKLSATSFACPNGTIFNQANKVCTPHEQVSCELATRFYDAHRGVVDSGGTDPAQYEPQNNVRPWVPENLPPKPQNRFQPPPQSRPQPQPQPQSRPQPQPARPPPQSSSRNQPQSQPRSQSQSRPQPAPHENAFRPLTQPPQLGRPSQPISLPQPAPQTTARPGLFKPSILLGARRNSFRPPQFLSSSSAGTTPTTTTTTSTTTTTQNPLSVEYVYDYVDYDPQGVPSSPPPPQPLSNQRQKRSSSDDKQRRRGPIQPVDYLPPREYTTQLRVSSFTCSDKLPGAVYADVENQCKMFHICLPVSKGKMEDHQLFCGQGLAYNQEKGACEEPTNFNCSKSEDYYMYD